jgi:hypothetical protein
MARPRMRTTRPLRSGIRAWRAWATSARRIGRVPPGIAKNMHGRNLSEFRGYPGRNSGRPLDDWPFRMVGLPVQPHGGLIEPKARVKPRVGVVPVPARAE